MIGPEEGVMQSRAQAMAAMLEIMTDQPLIVCNGFPSREACKLRDRDQNFYMIGSMGASAGIGLGLAMAQPGKTVVVFDGDWNDPLRKDWFMLVNSYLRMEMEFFNWSPYKIDIQYHPKHRIMVKYK